MKIDNAGAVIRRIREKKGISLRELARRLGKGDQGLLGKYERNDLGLSLEVLSDIAIALEREPAAVVLECLKEVYPQLQGTEVGGMLDELVNALEKRRS